MTGISRAGALLATVIVLAATGCKPENKYVAPPLTEIGVAPPLSRPVTEWLEATGNAAAFNQVDLVARVPGFLQQISYRDDDFAKKGTLLFTIEPAPYEAKLKEAQGALEGAKAQLAQSEAALLRQEILVKQRVSDVANLQLAQAKRDSDRGNVLVQEGILETATINLGYTQVRAPFDGVVSRHLVSVGAMVGLNTPTTLATVVQLNPIYVMFNLSEQQILRRRAHYGGPMAMEDLRKIPIEIGLMTEDGYPHKGHLDYAAPAVAATTGTLLVRGVFDNPNHALLPGFFVRVRMPAGPTDQQSLLVPDTVVGENQQGHYLMVVNARDEVEQRHVVTGEKLGDLRVITRGLKADDRVVVTGLQRAIPGRKVKPVPATIPAPPAAG
jgi:multidrug efflux system membrane fusion protein